MEIKNIAEGFLNLTKKHLNIADVEVEKLAVWRYSKCLQCDQQDKSNLSCKLCGCHTPAKVRANESSCPIGRW